MKKTSELSLNLIPFKPVVPFWTGHSQTVLGHIIPSAKLSGLTEEKVLTLPDGDQLLLEYRSGQISGTPTLSVYHGLGGDGESDYIRRSANLALARGWNIIRVHHRGASAKAKAVKSYHSGRGEDVEAVLNWSRSHFKSSRQVALGFSMSGSILLNLLTRRSGIDQPDFGVVVNAPLDLQRSSELLTVGFSKLYDLRFYAMLKKLIQSQDSDFKLPPLGRVLDIDDAYTAPRNGYKDRNDYYEQCSAGNYVQNIETPTFALTAEDDPFVDFENYQSALWPDSVHRTFLKYGGHMGYIHRHKIENHGHRWLDHYLETVFQAIESK